MAVTICTGHDFFNEEVTKNSIDLMVKTVAVRVKERPRDKVERRFYQNKDEGKG